MSSDIIFLYVIIKAIIIISNSKYMGKLDSASPSGDGVERIKALADSAITSMDKVRIDNVMMAVLANLQEVQGNDWSDLRSRLEKQGMTDEEDQAVNSTISALQALVSVQDKEPVLKRAASKIVDIAIGNKVLGRVLNPSSSILNAAKNFYEAVACFATQKDLQASLVYLGGVMSDEEIKTSKERLGKIDIS